MHVLHLPPRHLWRISALAALLTVTLTGIIVLAVGQVGPSSDSSAGGTSDRVSSSAPELATQHVRSPLAPPTVFNQPLASPLSTFISPSASPGRSR
jgi:hypothetical protein